MSETHAHTAKAQADVQTGRPHTPPGHVEADRPVRRLSEGQRKPFGPWVIAGGLGVAVVLVIAFIAG